VTTVKLKYVDHFLCRHGHSRYYFRRGKGPRIPLPGKPGTAEFMSAYQQALQGAKPQNLKSGRLSLLEPSTLSSTIIIKARIIFR